MKLRSLEAQYRKANPLCVFERRKRERITAIGTQLLSQASSPAMATTASFVSGQVACEPLPTSTSNENSPVDGYKGPAGDQGVTRGKRWCKLVRGKGKKGILPDQAWAVLASLSVVRPRIMVGWKR